MSHRRVSFNPPLVSNFKARYSFPMKDCEHYVSCGVLAFLFLFSSLSNCQNNAVPQQRANDEQEIREVVIRKQMVDWIAGADKAETEAKGRTDKAIAKMLNFKIFFISINGKDPSPAFVSRFHDLPRLIKKVSDSETAKAWRMAVIDKASHQRGIRFSADEIRWRGSDSVEVEGGYHCDGLCGAGIKFEVQREKNHWVVKSSRMEWIS